MKGNDGGIEAGLDSSQSNLLDLFFFEFELSLLLIAGAVVGIFVLW